MFFSQPLTARAPTTTRNLCFKLLTIQLTSSLGLKAREKIMNSRSRLGRISLRTVVPCRVLQNLMQGLRYVYHLPWAGSSTPWYAGEYTHREPGLTRSERTRFPLPPTIVRSSDFKQTAFVLANALCSMRIARVVVFVPTPS